MSAYEQRVARFYDLQLRLERGPIAAAIDLASPRADDRLLDIGTGTGAVLRRLAQHPSPPREAIGLDSSPAMLARVPELPAGWSLRQGDATRIPFGDAHFDLVITAYLLHLLDPPTVGRALAEIRRVLKPSGRLITVTPVAPRSVLRRPYELFVSGLAHVSETSIGLRPFDPRGELTGHGFAVARSRYVPLGYPSLCVLARPVGS